eukprot:TRINITY_DN1379_c0_g1_i1.p1 TRINITY_DN1379_c0_g1~~TRINITY_DN1379_c0_g1_i1.p1  ORF type:complete len:596 (+),score=116.42 TRINITY_DN1379_c0_g1_i1:538-2325(+)
MSLRAGLVVAFLCSGINLLVIILQILIHRLTWIDKSKGEKEALKMFEIVGGHAFGVCMVSLILKVGGVTMDMAGATANETISKSEREEIEPLRSPGLLLSKIGENVSNVSGNCMEMLACHSLLLLALEWMFSGSKEIVAGDGALYFPLVVISIALLLHIIAYSIVARFGIVNDTEDASFVENSLLWPFNIFCIMMPIFLYILVAYNLPDQFSSGDKAFAAPTSKYNVLWTGFDGLGFQFLTPFIVDFFIKRNSNFIKTIAESARNSASTNVLRSFAVGHLSAFFPIILLLVLLFMAWALLQNFGIVMLAFTAALTYLQVITVKAVWPVCTIAAAIGRKLNDDHIIRRSQVLERGVFYTSEFFRTMEINILVLSAVAILAIVGQKAAIDTLDVMKVAIFCGLLGGAALVFYLSGCYLHSVSTAQVDLLSFIKAFIRNHGKEHGYDEEKETLQQMLERSTGVILLPVISVIIIPILIVVFFGMQMLIAVITGAVLGGLFKAYTLSNSCGILTNILDYIQRTSTKDDYQGASQALQAAMVGGSFGVGLREPYALSFVLFFKCLGFIAFYSFGLATSTSLLAKWLGTEMAGAAAAAPKK